MPDGMSCQLTMGKFTGECQISQSTYFPSLTSVLYVTIKWHATFHVSFSASFLARAWSRSAEYKVPWQNTTDQKNPLARFKILDQDAILDFPWMGVIGFCFPFCQSQSPSVSCFGLKPVRGVQCPTPTLRLFPPSIIKPRTPPTTKPLNAVVAVQSLSPKIKYKSIFRRIPLLPTAFENGGSSRRKSIGLQYIPVPESWGVRQGTGQNRLGLQHQVLSVAEHLHLRWSTRLLRIERLRLKIRIEWSVLVTTPTPESLLWLTPFLSSYPSSRGKATVTCAQNNVTVWRGYSQLYRIESSLYA